MVFTHQGTIKTNLDLSMAARAERPSARVWQIGGSRSIVSLRSPDSVYLRGGGSGARRTGRTGSPRRS